MMEWNSIQKGCLSWGWIADKASFKLTLFNEKYYHRENNKLIVIYGYYEDGGDNDTDNNCDRR